MTETNIERKRRLNYNQTSYKWARNNPEKVRKIRERYQMKNRDKINERDRAARAEGRKPHWREARIKKHGLDKVLEQDRGYILKRKYGITLEQYNKMLKAQKGVCAICKGPNQQKGKALHVDHCHSLGIVRGLLCSNCNTALGKVEKVADWFENAQWYLANYPIHKDI